MKIEDIFARALLLKDRDGRGFACFTYGVLEQTLKESLEDYQIKLLDEELKTYENGTRNK